MATQLSITNKVLRRLREDTVTATTDNEYAQLISEFVADIHREVVEARKWQSCYHELVFDYVVGQNKYILSRTIANGGDVRNSNTQVPTRRSVVQTDVQGVLAFQYDDDADTYGDRLALVSYAEAKRRNAEDTDNPQENPFFFALSNDGVDLFAYFPYDPTIAEKVLIHFDTEDAELESDGSTDAVVIAVPNRPIYLGALAMALNERGEEIGEPGNIASARYNMALGAAMEADMTHDELTNVYDWRRD